MVAIKKSVRYILDGLTLPVFVVAPDEVITFMNKAAKARYAEADAGLDFKQVITSKKCHAALKDVLAGKPNEQVNVTLQGVVPTAFRVSLSRLDSDSSKEPSCVLSFEDVSHIREAEQMRHDFVANVSHELRSPLTALSGFVETLQGAAANDRVARERFLGMMENEAERMAGLIDDLLSLSKLQASERVSPTSSSDVYSVIARVTSSLAGIASRSDIKIKTDLNASIPLVLGDSRELTQVFQNLIENAVKYSPEGSEVTVSFCDPEKGKSHLCICVKDEGEGIDPVHIPRLTETIFIGWDKGRSRAKGGNGDLGWPS